MSRKAFMIRSSSVSVAGAVVVFLAACSAGPSANAPVPDPSDTPSGSPVVPEPVSPPPTATNAAEKQSWLVQGENSYLSGTGRYCSWDESLTAENPEYPAIGFTVLGGPPDDWNGTDMFDDSSPSVGLNLVTRKYTASRFDGDLATGLGTSWDTKGTFTFERNAAGVVTGGRGTGTTKIILPSGDVERPSDVITFTVTPIEEMDWCNF